MTTTTYENSVRIGSTTYQVVATADPDLSVDLAGVDGSGVLVAEGTIRLPSEAGAKIGKLLAQVLEALGRLSTANTPSSRDRPANANQPWTQDLDDGLRADWLAATTDTPTAELIRSIAKRLERSPTSIRSRLAKVGCDPDVPGRPLSAEAAAVFQVQGPDQGRVRGKPDSGGEGGR